MQEQVKKYVEWCKKHHYKPSNANALLQYCKRHAMGVSGTLA